MNRKIISVATERAPAAVGPYSQALLVAGGERLLFVSGQLPVDPKSKKMIEGDIRAMTHRAIDNIEAIVVEAGGSLASVVRVEIFLTDIAHFAAVNEEYAKRFTSSPLPARQAVQVAALPLAAPIEISCIAVL